jgi:hypothetical protein
VTNRLAMVIFSIDNSSDVHQQAKFLRYVDGLRAMGKLVGGVSQCIGCYKGTLERSYMMLLVDFDKYIRNSGFVSDQESFLHIPGDVRQPCVLEYQTSGVREALGPMKEFPMALDYVDSWTYIEETGKYYVC